MRTCHFKHGGLKLGDPLAAPSSSVKRYNIGVPSAPGAAAAQRAGSEFSGVVWRGKRVKRRRRGEGMAKALRTAVAVVPEAGAGSGTGSVIVVFWVDGGVG